MQALDFKHQAHIRRRVGATGPPVERHLPPIDFLVFSFSGVQHEH